VVVKIDLELYDSSETSEIISSISALDGVNSVLEISPREIRVSLSSQHQQILDV